MKVGIITITNGQNYGNRLQNYAVQKALEKMGHSAETIRDTTGHYDSLTTKARLKMYFKMLTKLKLSDRDERIFKFDNFTKKYIKQCKYPITRENVPESLKTDYDAFVCGSDQIWNPDYGFVSGNSFLEFAKPKQRIAFSASFGVNEIPEKRKEEYKKRLEGLNYISVRENSGADIVEQLTGKKAEVLLDPTMMLDKEEWLQIAKKPSYIKNDKFILTYFLGGRSKEMRSYIEKIAKEKGYQVVNLEIEWCDPIENKKVFDSDPGEFIWLINNCRLMLTDSFHGCVFSILMGKPFRIFSRVKKAGESDTSSRTEVLLNKFSLQKSKGNLEETTDTLFEADYSKVPEVLAIERQKTYDYLTKALAAAKE